MIAAMAMIANIQGLKEEIVGLPSERWTQIIVGNNENDGSQIFLF